MIEMFIKDTVMLCIAWSSASPHETRTDLACLYNPDADGDADAEMNAE